jgi:hypothetical protein
MSEIFSGDFSIGNFGFAVNPDVLIEKLSPIRFLRNVHGRCLRINGLDDLMLCPSVIII